MIIIILITVTYNIITMVTNIITEVHYTAKTKTKNTSSPRCIIQQKPKQKTTTKNTSSPRCMAQRAQTVSRWE